MKRLALAAVIATLATPSLAGIAFELPRMTWPEPEPTISTSNCTASQPGCTG